MSVLDLRSNVQVQHQHEFFSALGTYWTEHFEDRDVTQAFADAAQMASLQQDLDNTLAVQVMTDRKTGALYRTLIWYRVRVWEQDIRSINDPNLRAFGFGGAFGQDQIPYGGLSQLWVFDVTQNLTIPRCLTNKVTNPDFVAHPGAGLYFEPGRVGIKVNPFNSEYFQPQQDPDGRYVDLWFYLSDFDVQAWSRQYGIAVAASGPTSEAYRALVDGLWMARVAGPSDAALFRVVEGCTGVPMVHTARETVEWVGVQGSYLCVVTDQECYRFPSTHTAAVEVGDVVVQGQNLTTALELKSGASLVSGEGDIVLPPGMFDPAMGIRKPIRFPNARVAVQDGGLTAEGNRITRFLLDGEGSDLARFRVGAADRELWRVLDRRGRVATTVAQAQDLVSTINPAVELVARHTTPHLLLLDGDQSLWPAHPDLQAQLQRQLDRVAPPHARVVVQTNFFTVASSSYSSQSYQSSSSSTVGNTASTMSSYSSVSTQSASSLSSISTGSSQSNSSSSDRSTASTASTASSNSSSSSESPFSDSSLSSRSLSSQSLSTQSVSSQSSRSSQSLSSRSSASTASTASSISTVSASSDTQSTASTQTASSNSSSSSLSNSISSQSSASTPSSNSSSSSLSTILDTPSSASTLTTASASTVSASSVSLSSDSSKSSGSESSKSRSLSSASSQSLSSRSSQSDRSESSQSRSSASSNSSLTSGTNSSRSESISSVSTASSQSSNSTPQTPSSLSSRSSDSSRSNL